MFWLVSCQLKVQQLAACDWGDQGKRGWIRWLTLFVRVAYVVFIRVGDNAPSRVGDNAPSSVGDNAPSIPNYFGAVFRFRKLFSAVPKHQNFGEILVSPILGHGLLFSASRCLLTRRYGLKVPIRQ